MDVLELCQQLIERAEISQGKEYDASMTLQGILHNFHVIGHRNLVSHDLDKYAEYKDLIATIQNMRDMYRAEQKAAMLSR